MDAPRRNGKRPHASVPGPARRDLRRAWMGIVLVPIGFAVAMLLGEGVQSAGIHHREYRGRAPRDPRAGRRAGDPDRALTRRDGAPLRDAGQARGSGPRTRPGRHRRAGRALLDLGDDRRALNLRIRDPPTSVTGSSGQAEVLQAVCRDVGQAQRLQLLLRPGRSVGDGRHGDYLCALLAGRGHSIHR